MQQTGLRKIGDHHARYGGGEYNVLEHRALEAGVIEREREGESALPY